MKTLVLLISLSLVIFSCNTSSKKVMENQKSFSLEKLWSTDTLLTTCESVLYDKERNVLYVSDIAGGFNGIKNDGFISRVSLQGKILDRKWVAGIETPKGLGIYGDELYVTEATALVIININEARVVKRIPVEGAEFLNDISVDESGKVFFSDSKTNVIYTYSNGKVEKWLEGIDQVNGLLCEDSTLKVGAADFYSVNYATKQITMINDSINGADGVTAVGNDYYLVSEWAGRVYLISPDKSISQLLNTTEMGINSADIEYIQKDSLLLVPTFFKNNVVAYKLKAD